ncbi:MAG: rhodanese family protein [Rhodospirillales bacterium]
MSLTPVNAATALAWIENGEAVLMDIRDSDERRRCRVTHAVVYESGMPLPEGKKVIFHCRSGMRTQARSQDLSAEAGDFGFALEGGLDAWKKAGGRVLEDSSQPIEIMRQVQITAGSLILLGVFLAHFVSPWFLLLAGGVGAGLTLAGVTGSCMLAGLLAKMPWNKGAAQGATCALPPNAQST